MDYLSLLDDRYWILRNATIECFEYSTISDDVQVQSCKEVSEVIAENRCESYSAQLPIALMNLIGHLRNLFNFQNFSDMNQQEIEDLLAPKQYCYTLQSMPRNGDLTLILLVLFFFLPSLLVCIININKKP